MATRLIAPPAPWLRRYIVGMLMVAAVVSYIDRQILTVLLESIRHDLKLSDTQLGLLTGVFFSAFFIIGGIPLARLSDRRNRRTITAACLAAWSGATVLCGAAQSYAQLAAARALVAVGEAGSAPAAGSIISDLFDPRDRARIFALMSCGSAIGIAFGIYLGGTLNEQLGWRGVLYFVGAIGAVFALIFYFTVPEPSRPELTAAEKQTLSLKEAVAGIVRLTSFRWLALIAIFASATSYAVLGWMPAFLIRVHGLSTGDVGVQMGTAVVIGLLTGNLTCGALAHRLGGRDVRWLIWIVAVGLLTALPLGVLAMTVASTSVCLIIFTVFMIAVGFWYPPVVTIAVGLVDTRSRALIASTMPIWQAVGGAIGPSSVGILSDRMARAHGAESLRYALIISLVGYLIAGVASILAARSVAREYRLPEGPTASH